MSPSSWQTVWTLTLIGGLGLFTVVSVYVAIAGVRDIRRMFADLAQQLPRVEDSNEE